MRFSCSMCPQGMAGSPAPVSLHSPAQQLFAQPSRQTAIQDSITETRFGSDVLRLDSATPCSDTAPFCARWCRSPLAEESADHEGRPH